MMPECIAGVYSELTSAQTGRVETVPETLDAASETLRHDFRSLVAAALLDQWKADLERLNAELIRRDAIIRAVLDSKSWRLTAPLRGIANYLGYCPPEGSPAFEELGDQSETQGSR